MYWQKKFFKTENVKFSQSILQIKTLPMSQEVKRKTALFGLKRKIQGFEIPKSVVEILLIWYFLLLVCFFFVFFPGFFSLEDGGLLTQCIFFPKPWRWVPLVKCVRQFFSQKFPALLLLSLHDLILSTKGKRGGGAKRYNFNRNSFWLLYNEKTVLNLCIYMYI